MKIKKSLINKGQQYIWMTEMFNEMNGYWEKQVSFVKEA